LAKIVKLLVLKNKKVEIAETISTHSTLNNTKLELLILF